MTAERIFAALIAFALGAAAGALAANRPEWVAYAVLAASVAFICWGLAVTLAEPSPGDEERPTSPPSATFTPSAWAYGLPDLPPGMTYEQYWLIHTPDGFVRLHYDTETGDHDIRALWPTDTGAPE